MTLFDDIQRYDTGPAAYAEGLYEYLNRSARQDVGCVRDLLEQWFENYPDDAKADVCARFKRADREHHYGAYNELYCYSLLSALDFEIVIPPHSQGLRQPDYEVSKDGELRFFLESTIACEFGQGSATYARMSQIYDALNRLESPDFFIGLDIHEYPDHAPSGARIRRFLEGRLSGLDSGEVGRALESGVPDEDSPYYWMWEEDGFRISFYPIPKSEEARGRTDIRPVGVLGSRAHKNDDAEVIQTALERKATRYGRLNAPYLIALNAFQAGIDTEDVMEALFGQIRTFVSRSTGALSERRAATGLWQSSNGPINTRVSAVLLQLDINPWAVASNMPVLWHNPFAEYPLDTSIWTGPQRVLNTTSHRMELIEGRTADDIFQLDSQWPSLSS